MLYTQLPPCPSVFLSLPHELIVDILARLDPRDVSATSRTCSQLNCLIETSSSLWRSLYLNTWDTPPSALELPTLPSSTGDLKPQGTPSSMKDIVKQRRKARSELRAGTQSLHRMLIGHTTTLSTLISAMRNRKSRQTCREDPNSDAPFSKTAAALASMFPHNIEGDLRWATFVYPREDVLMLQDWQHSVRQEEAEQACSKRGQRQSASGTPGKKVVKPPVSEKKSSSASSSVEPMRRRSSRIRRAKVPSDLWGFLEEGRPGDIPNFCLEQVEFEEQLAAELHCLHGVRHMSPPLILDQRSRVRRRDHDELQPRKRRRSPRTGAKAEPDEDGTNRRYQSVEPEREEDYRARGKDLDPINCYVSHDVADATDRHGMAQANDTRLEALHENDNVADAEDLQDLRDEDITSDGEDDAPSYSSRWSGIGSRRGYLGDVDLRGRAKEKVYDVGRYAYENAWGPFKPFRAGTRSFSRRNGMAEEGIPMRGMWGPLTIDEGQTDNADDSDEEMMPDDASSVGTGTGPDDPVVEMDADEVEDLHRDREAAGDASTTHSRSEGTDGGEGRDGDWTGRGPNDDEEDEDSEIGFGFPFFDDRDQEDRFAEMIWEVTAYSGSKVRNEVERIRGVEAGFNREYSGPRQRNAEGAYTHSLSWQRERSVDWVLLEAIMVSVHTSLTPAIMNLLWGRGFKLPFGARGDDPGGDELGPLDGCVHARQRRLLAPPTGWCITRGEEETSQHQTKSNGSDTIDAALDDSGVVIEDSTLSATQQQPTAASLKPYDWARVESATWAGSYWFCDYPMFLRYNASVARDPNVLQTGCSVMRLEEAIGDCLQLRMELNPMDRQEARFEEGDEEATSNGPEDPEFPTLRFTGHTLTHADEEAPRTRGGAHGYVRPVYVSDGSQSRYHAASGRWLPAIAGIHWKITHAYDGQDRWSLCGVQPGPPGTRAPIYGIWSDVEDEEASPVGPFCYMNVDSRPWKEVERLLRQQELAHETQRRQRERRNGQHGQPIIVGGREEARQ